MSDLSGKVEGLNFLDKLIAIWEEGEINFWEERQNPPNLSRKEFEMVLYRIDEPIRPTWVDRRSEAGPHGETGEDKCFKFNCEVKFGGIFETQTRCYFVKGYFFAKEILKGVAIQSFREE